VAELSSSQVIALAEALEDISRHPGWEVYQAYLAEQYHAAADAALSGTGPEGLTRGELMLYWQGYRTAVEDIRVAPSRIIAQGAELKRRLTEAKK
jgi:hypothetical protein